MGTAERQTEGLAGERVAPVVRHANLPALARCRVAASGHAELVAERSREREIDEQVEEPTNCR